MHLLEGYQLLNTLYLWCRVRSWRLRNTQRSVRIFKRNFSMEDDFQNNGCLNSYNMMSTEQKLRLLEECMECKSLQDWFNVGSLLGTLTIFYGSYPLASYRSAVLLGQAPALRGTGTRSLHKIFILPLSFLRFSPSLFLAPSLLRLS